MKRLLSTLTALALFATAANAQLLGRFGSTQVLAGGTNVIMNLGTNTYSLVVDCRDVNDLGIQVSCMLLSSNFCHPRFDFMESADGTTWTSTNFVQIGPPMNAGGGFSTNDLCTAAQCCYYTNLDVRGKQALKLFRAANTNYHGIMSNVTLTVTTKR